MIPKKIDPKDIYLFAQSDEEFRVEVCRRYNAFDDLLAACKIAIETAEMGNAFDYESSEKIRAAIKQAEAN